jgi:predicted transposase YdaD
MANVKLSEDNRLFLMDMVKKLEIDKKLREEGKMEGKIEGILEGKIKGKIEGILEGKIEGKMESKIESATNLLKLGISIDVVIKAIGLPEKDVMEIAKSLEEQ